MKKFCAGLIALGIPFVSQTSSAGAITAQGPINTQHQVIVCVSTGIYVVDSSTFVGVANFNTISLQNGDGTSAIITNPGNGGFALRTSGSGDNTYDSLTFGKYGLFAEISSGALNVALSSGSPWVEFSPHGMNSANVLGKTYYEGATADFNICSGDSICSLVKNHYGSWFYGPGQWSADITTPMAVGMLSPESATTAFDVGLVLKVDSVISGSMSLSLLPGVDGNGHQTHNLTFFAVGPNNTPSRNTLLTSGTLVVEADQVTKSATIILNSSVHSVKLVQNKNGAFRISLANLTSPVIIGNSDSSGAVTDLVYKCTGSATGAQDGILAAGNLNSALCSGGTWQPSQLQLVTHPTN